jgi:hypothetical protein
MKTIWMAAIVLFAGCVVPCQARAFVCSETIDLYAECSATTMANDSLVLARSPALPVLQATVCVDRRTGLLGLKILNAEVMKFEYTGDLLVQINVDSSRPADLLEFSKKYIGRNMVVIKNGQVLKLAALRSLLPSGHIALGVGSQGAADALMDAINGQCGAPSHSG